MWIKIQEFGKVMGKFYHGIEPTFKNDGMQKITKNDTLNKKDKITFAAWMNEMYLNLKLIAFPRLFNSMWCSMSKRCQYYARQ